MNASWKLIGLTAAMLGANAMPAMAINKEWSAALGFMGGVLATRAHDYRMMQRGDCGRSVYYAPPAPVRYCPPPVVQSCPPTVIVQQQPVVIQQQVVETGHYEWREEQQWVAGQWRYEEIGPNTYRKIWEPGFYRTVRSKVWVTDCP